jgi:hypothetical protein
MTCLGDDYREPTPPFEEGITYFIGVILAITYWILMLVILTPFTLIGFICRWVAFTFVFSSDRAIEHSLILAKFVIYLKDEIVPVTKPPYGDPDL